jgi:hypothetical protein
MNPPFASLVATPQQFNVSSALFNFGLELLFCAAAPAD